MFDQAKLAIVAYGEVSGFDGSSTKTNSGVTTTRLGLGTYQISLPIASQNQIGLTQFSDRDLIFIQPLGANTPVMSNASTVNDAAAGTPAAASLDVNKLVFFGASSTTAVDCDFSFLILRTLTPPCLSTQPGGPGPA